MPGTAVSGTTVPGAVVDREAWIRAYHPAPWSGVRLVVLPHAGGSATYYHPFSKALHPEIEVLSVQYPGRQDRRHEAPVEDIGTLADQVVAALGDQPQEPLALFGHSMGALVGFEVARRLERNGTPPVALFLSARRAPGTTRIENVHLRDDSGLLDEVKELSGTDPRVLQDPELLSLLLPAIRSDYRAVETYACSPGAAVGCPVSVLVGDSDPRVTTQDARAWLAHATGRFDLRVFSGGHFYLAEHKDAIADHVRGVLAPYLRRTPQ